jgi:hypothetical protein
VRGHHAGGLVVVKDHVNGWKPTMPAWVDSRVRWTEFGDSAANWSWALTQPSVPVLVSK